MPAKRLRLLNPYSEVESMEKRPNDDFSMLQYAYKKIKSIFVDSSQIPSTQDQMRVDTPSSIPPTSICTQTPNEMNSINLQTPATPINASTSSELYRTEINLQSNEQNTKSSSKYTFFPPLSSSGHQNYRNMDPPPCTSTPPRISQLSFDRQYVSSSMGSRASSTFSERLPTVARMKYAAAKPKYDSLLTRLSYRDTVQSGFQGSRKDFQDYLKYAALVLESTRKPSTFQRPRSTSQRSLSRSFITSSSSNEFQSPPSESNHFQSPFLAAESLFTSSIAAPPQPGGARRTAPHARFIDDFAPSAPPSTSFSFRQQEPKSANFSLSTQLSQSAPPNSALDNEIFIKPSSKNTALSVEDGEEAWVQNLRAKIESLLSQPSSLTSSSAAADSISTSNVLRLKERNAQIDLEIERKIKKSQPIAIPKLSASQAAMIQKAFQQKSGVIVKRFNIPITPKDIAKLHDRQWLNDEIINFYGNLIMERSNNHEKLSPATLPRSFFFNTFFYTSLRDHGYAKVRRWTKKVNLFEKHLILVPVHLGMHWCCAVINFVHKRFEYYDSLHGSNTECFELMRYYVMEESKDKRQQDFDFSDWTDYSPKNIPAQQNGYDCGVFACIYAEHVSRSSTFDFNQSHMPFLRQRMVYEICSEKLIDDDG